MHAEHYHHKIITHYKWAQARHTVQLSEHIQVSMLKWKYNTLQNNFYWSNVLDLNLGVVCFSGDWKKTVFLVLGDSQNLNVKGYLKLRLIHLFLSEFQNMDLWRKWSTGRCMLTRSWVDIMPVSNVHCICWMLWKLPG